MRLSGTLVVCALFTCVSLPAAPPEGYRLAWSDEFNGSGLDTAKWHYRTDSKLWSTQLPADLSIAGGNLVLTLKKEDAGGMHYTGGGIISKRTFQYGYYECRFRIDAGDGWHSSFWLMKYDGARGTGTKTAELELDVVENDSIHPDSYGTTTHKWPPPHLALGHEQITTTRLAGYYVYGCEYTTEKVNYFMHDKVVQTADCRGTFITTMSASTRRSSVPEDGTSLT
jgi:beta-glucanase (GH16 family)